MARMTVPKFSSLKGERKLVCLTAYDVTTAGILDEAGVDLILVGDSMGNVILGHETTLPVTLDDMITHAAAVRRARPDALVIVDMPYLSFHVSPEDTLRNAGRIIQETGADGVKLEGGKERVPHIRHLLQGKIPVMGHLGLTPQSVLQFGGYRVQGRSERAAREIREHAKALEEAGCFAVVLEGVPATLAQAITGDLSVPTIGIGAGPACDGQILVVNDLLGMSTETPKFVRRYAELRETMREAIRRYAEDVREGKFPGPEETYSE